MEDLKTHVGNDKGKKHYYVREKRTYTWVAEKSLEEKHIIYLRAIFHNWAVKFKSGSSGFAPLEGLISILSLLKLDHATALVEIGKKKDKSEADAGKESRKKAIRKLLWPVLPAFDKFLADYPILKINDYE